MLKMGENEFFYVCLLECCVIHKSSIKIFEAWMKKVQMKNTVTF